MVKLDPVDVHRFEFLASGSFLLSIIRYSGGAQDVFVEFLLSSNHDRCPSAHHLKILHSVGHKPIYLGLRELLLDCKTNSCHWSNVLNPILIKIGPAWADCLGELLIRDNVLNRWLARVDGGMHLWRQLMCHLKGWLTLFGSIYKILLFCITVMLRLLLHIVKGRVKTIDVDWVGPILWHCQLFSRCILFNFFLWWELLAWAEGAW